MVSVGWIEPGERGRPLPVGPIEEWERVLGPPRRNMGGGGRLGQSRLARSAHPGHHARAAQRVEDLGRRHPIAGPGVRRVGDRTVLGRRQPARVDPLLLADHLGPEPVRGEPAPAPAGRHAPRRSLNRQALRIDSGHADRHDLGQPVGAAPAEQDVRQAAGGRGRLRRVHAGCGAVAGRGLRRGGPGTRRAVHGRLAGRGVVGVGDDPLHLDRDRHPLPVVDVEQAPDGPAGARGHEAIPRRRDRLQPRAVGLGVEGRPPLHEDEAGAVGETVLARVVGDGHAVIAAKAVELLPQAERRAEGDGARGAVAQPERRHRGDHDTLGWGEVGEARGHIAVEDLVDFIAPGHCHPADSSTRYVLGMAAHREAVLALGASDCEDWRPGLLHQPVNSLSSLAYLVAGVWITMRPGGDRVGVVYAGAVIGNGIGSMLYHGPGWPGSAFVHDAAVPAVLLFIAVDDIALLRGWTMRRRLTGYATLLGAAGLTVAIAPAASAAVAAAGPPPAAGAGGPVLTRYPRRTPAGHVLPPAGILLVAGLAALAGRTDSPL